VAGAAVVMYGVFGASIFYLGRQLLKLSTTQSAFIAFFDIF
jgi:hypothetical protein